MTLNIKLPDLSRLQGIRQRLNIAEHDLASQRERFQRIKNRHENGTASRAVSAFQLFQPLPA